MLYKKDFSSGQFTRLKNLYRNATLCLDDLSMKYPEHETIWDIVRKKMEIINHTIQKDELPTDDRKRDADISTMITHELLNDYFCNSNELDPLYELDTAFTLLGMKDITFKEGGK